MDQNIKFRLLDLIGKFYPLGLPFLTTQYEGYHRLCQILNDKIEKLKENKFEPWQTLVKEVKELYPEKSFLDRAFIQYPSSHLIIVLKKSSEGIIKRNRTFQLFISHLGPYYTVLQAENSTISKQKKIDGLGITATLLVYPASQDEETLHRSITEITTKHFPGHQFLEYEELNTLKFLGVLPHGEDIESVILKNPKFEFSAFELLFGCNHLY